MQRARDVARAEQAVLIQGETGTGKELIARALHDLSPRAQAPFVPVNCGNLNPEILDSELFGHRKGSFTGAHEARLGLARQASSGTLFLDEIAELSWEAQPRLLRMLDHGEMRPVGSDQIGRVDIRVVSATHQDLRRKVELGTFRRDLYHRLAAHTVQLPALRQRVDDIPILVEHFCEEVRDHGISFAGVDGRVLEQMAQYDWPGNIRELRNAVYEIASRTPAGRIAQSWTSPAGISSGPLFATEEQVDAALRECGGRILVASAMLGITKQKLYRLCERYRIDYAAYRKS